MVTSRHGMDRPASLHRAADRPLCSIQVGRQGVSIRRKLRGAVNGDLELVDDVERINGEYVLLHGCRRSTERLKETQRHGFSINRLAS